MKTQLIGLFGLVAGGLLLADTASATVSALAYYRCGENDPGAVAGNAANSTTVDLIGGTNLSVLGTRPTYSASTGVTGSTLCLALNGGGYTNNSAFNLLDNWGIECWAMSAGAPGGYALIVGNGLDSDGAAIDINPSGNWFGYVAYPEAFIGSVASVPGVWTHLALVTSGGTTTFYVNGVAAGSAHSALSPSSSFKFGINTTGGGTQPFHGSIDEVRAFTFQPGQFSTNDLLLTHVPPPPPVLISGPTATPLGYMTNGTESYASGTSVSLAVAVGGTGPFSYQWLQNSNNVPNGTNATLSLNNGTSTNSGNYSVVVANAYGAVTSGVVSVSFSLPGAPGFFPVAYYRCGENDPGAVAGQTANGTTVDIIGGANLSVLGTPPTYSASTGVKGSTLCLAVNGGGYTNNPAFHLLDNWGMELWAMSAGATGDYAQLVFNGSSSWELDPGMGIGMDPVGNWFGFAAYPEAFIGSVASSPGVWTHLALVTSGGTTTFYVNGVVAATTSGTVTIPSSVFSFGINVDGGGTQPFQGNIDEVRVFAFQPGQFSTNDLLLTQVPPAAITVASSLNPSTYGTPVTFTATATATGGTTPTGTVTFYDGATILGTNTLNAGVATFTATNLLVTGSAQTITAVYSGDSNYAGSTNTLPGGQTVNPIVVTLSGTYNGTASMAGGSLSVVNNIDGANLTLSGIALLASGAVGSEAAVAPLTPAFVRSATGSTGSSAATSISVTMGTAPANGDTLVAVISTRGTSSSGEVSSISQTGATWTRATYSTGTGGSTTEIWSAPNVSGAGTAVTINLASSLFASAVVAEYSGVLSASAVDQIASNTGNGTSADTGTTAATVQANELWIGGIGLASSGYTLGTPNNSFTSVNSAASTSGAPSSNSLVYALAKIVSATGTADSGGTVSGTGITLRGSTTANWSSGSTITINKPTGVVAGDVMIACIAQEESSGGAAASLSGWTLLKSGGLGGQTAKYGTLLYKVAGSSEGSSYAFTLSGTTIGGAVGEIVAYYNVDNGTPIDANSSSFSASSGRSTTLASTTAINTVTDGALAILFGMGASPSSGGAGSFSAWTDSLTQVFSSANGGSGATAAIVGAGSKTIASHGTTGAGSATMTSMYNAGCWVALRPASQQWSGAMAAFKAAGTVLTLGGTAAGNYTLAGVSSVTVTPKALTVTGVTASAKVYDGTTTEPLGGSPAFLATEAAGSGTTSDGHPYSVDTVSPGGTAAGTFADRNVATGKAVTTSVTVTGTGYGNYSVTQPTGLTASITPKALTVTGVSASAKVYDGTTTEPLGGSPAFLATEAAGSGTTSDGHPYSVDTVSPGGTAAGTFATKDVATGKPVTTSVTATGTGNGNYTVTQPTGLTASITQKTLTVTSLTASAKIYDGTTTAPLGGSPAFLGTETAGSGTTSDGHPYNVDSVSPGGTASGTFATKDVGTGKTVTVTGVSVTGTGYGNYSATQQTGLTANINQTNLTVTAATNTKSYDGNTTATATATITAGSIVAGDTEPTWTETYDTKNVGTGKTLTPAGVVGDGHGGANYNVTFTPDTTGVINLATLNVSANGTLVYGQDPTNAIYTPIYYPLQDGDTSAVVSGNATFGTDATATSYVGATYSVTTVSTAGLSAANYSFANGTNGIMTVTPAPLTVTNATASDKDYDGTIAATIDTGAAGLDGFVNGDDAFVTLDSSSAVGTFDTRDVGTGKTVTFTGFAATPADGLATNYTVIQPTTTASIFQTNLTVTAAANTKTYDGTTSATATPTITAGSIQTGDTEGAWTETYDTRDVGTGKTLTPAGVVSDGNGGANYNYTYAPVATGEIDRADLTVTAVANTKTYDGTTTATATATITAGSIQTGDTAPTWTETYDTRDVGTGKTLTPVTGVVSDGNGGANYNVTFTPEATGEIDRAGLTVTAVANSKTYDGTTSATATATITAGSIQSGDTAPTWTETYDTRDVGTGKTLTPAGVVSDGNGGANYNVTLTAAATGEIDRAGLTVTAVANTKTYDGNTSATATPTISAGSIQTGDTAPTWTETYDNASVGTGKTLTPAGVVSDGNGGANYNVTLTPAATGVINPATLYVSGNGTLVYGQDPTNAVYTPVYYTFLSGDTAGVVSGSATFSTDASATSYVGDTYTVTTVDTSGLSAANYSFAAGTNGIMTVTPAPLTVTNVASDKVYDGTTSAPINGGAGLDGLVNGDDAFVTLDSSSAVGTFDTRDVGTGKTVTFTGFATAGDLGTNYTVTQPTGLASIFPTNLTVTAAANTKTYDGDTTATATPTITAGGIQTGDTEGAWTETYDTRDAGTGKTLTPAGVVSDGNGGANYNYTYAPVATGEIDRAGLTVTATANTKTYDGDTTATATATITAGSIVAGDTAPTWTETYDTRDAGTGKTLTPAGVVSDGNGGANYNVTLTAAATGEIDRAGLTVTAVANTKTYDGTTSATATATITAGSIQSGDTAPTWTETYDTRDVGTGKTLTPAGVVSDGNGGANYNVTHTPVATGEIDQANLTVTAAANTKTYDGNTTATATPTITAGSIQTGDTAPTWTETYDTRDVGTGKTLTPAGVVSDGNGGANYNVTRTPVATGEIDRAGLTVTAAANTKTYDGTTSATATATITAGSIQSGDTAPTWTETYDTRDVGTGKTLTPAGVVGDGNGGANYNVTLTPVATGEIDRAALTVTAVANTKPYDGNTTATATPTISAGSIQTGDTAPTWTETYDNASVGTGKTLTPAGVVGDGNGGANYNLTLTPAATGVINPATLYVSGNGTLVYGQDPTNAVYTPVYYTFVNGDTAGVVSGSATFSTDASATSYVGDTYTVTTVDTSGLSAANYSFAAGTNGVMTVTPAPLTVTNVASDKVYDGTTSAPINGGAGLDGLVNGDDAFVTLDSSSAVGTFDTRDVGTGKTVTFTGFATAGDLGTNYTVTQPTGTASIFPTNLTVTAAANTKAYDGDTTATATPTITAGSIQTGDTEGAWTETYDTRDAGTGKTLTPAGVVGDGNGGANYNYTYAPVATGEIDPANLTVTAAANTKSYDGTTSATATATITAGSIQSGDTAPTWTETYDTRNAGTGKTLTPAGVVSDGNGGANYNVNLTPVSTGVISRAGLTVTAAVNTKTYDGNTTATATPTITAGSIQTGDTAPAWTETYDTAAVGTGKTLTPAGVVSDGNGGANYNYTYAAVTTGVISSSVPCSDTNAILGIVDNLDGTFTLTFQGTPNAEYYLVGNADLTAAMNTWTPVLGSTNTAPDPSGQWSSIVSNAAPQYYRLVATDPCSP